MYHPDKPMNNITARENKTSMTLTPAKTHWKASQHIKRGRLLQLLIAIGAIDKNKHRATNNALKAHGRAPGHTEHLPDHKLWDLYDLAKAKYIQQIKLHHPDRGGNHETATALNHIWQRLEFLFTRRGIGT
jgi:hypothetical protein